MEPNLQLKHKRGIAANGLKESWRAAQVDLIPVAVLLTQFTLPRQVRWQLVSVIPIK